MSVVDWVKPSLGRAWQVPCLNKRFQECRQFERCHFKTTQNKLQSLVYHLVSSDHSANFVFSLDHLKLEIHSITKRKTRQLHRLGFSTSVQPVRPKKGESWGSEEAALFGKFGSNKTLKTTGFSWTKNPWVFRKKTEVEQKWCMKNIKQHVPGDSIWPFWDGWPF